MLGEIEGRRRRGQQRMKWLGGITNEMDMSLSKFGKIVKEGSLVCYSSWGYRVRHDLATEQQQMPSDRASQMVLVLKNLPFNAGNAGLIPRSGGTPGGGHGNPL